MSPKITYEIASKRHRGVSDKTADVVDESIKIAEKHGFLLKEIKFNTDVHISPNHRFGGRKVGDKND